VYGLVDIEGNEIIKVKGVTSEAASEISFSTLNQLLVKDSTKEFTQEKWYKKVIEGEILVADTIYTLKITSNKRQPIYINNKFDSTRPYHLRSYDELIK